MNENAMTLAGVATALAKPEEYDLEDPKQAAESMVHSIWENHFRHMPWEEFKAQHLNVPRQELVRRRVESSNRTPGHLNEQDGYDCPLCLNRGYISFAEERDGTWTDSLRWCSCKSIRKNLLRLKKSGLSKGLHKLEDFRVEEPYQEEMMDTVRAWLAADHSKGASLFLGGAPGCGKTMLGTAACREMIFRGHDVVYMPWVSAAQKVKALAMDEKQWEEIGQYKNTEYLYIDDLFKPLPGQEGPSAADVRLAYDIVNHRYINHMPMIVSSEKAIMELANVDEATVSRLFEMADGFIVNVARKPGRNWRMKGMKEV